tara:strand:- start:858 stop:2822 length:1965 start_codon:yes stop_codon:yes gene_type:complete
MERFRDLGQILTAAAEGKQGIRFISGAVEEKSITYRDLLKEALSLLSRLQADGIKKSDELIIYTESNHQFIVAFWASILGGMIPVPISVGTNDEHRAKLFRIWEQLNHCYLFTETGILERLKTFVRKSPYANKENALHERAITWHPPKNRQPMDQVLSGTETHTPDPEDISFIQYSSGSTSQPKGICLTHNNLTANILAIIEGGRWNKQDRSLSWMPLTHDMGLIGYHLSTMAAGMNQALMDTSLFIRRPLLWLKKATEHKSTQLCSPNFGYKHFLNLYNRKGDNELELSNVKLILNGAEPISWALCEDFLNAMAPFGLKRSTMFPVYGLAEATVGVSFPTVGEVPARIIVNRHTLKIGSTYEECPEGSPDAISFLKVGKPIRFQSIRITNDNDIGLPEKTIGHIQIKGENVTPGIYQNESASNSLFSPDGWLRTGDCGVMTDGSLVITGREKDLIIVNGQNYYPHDIEEIITKREGLEPGKVVVAGSNLGTNATEEILTFILYRKDIESFAQISELVKTTVAEQAGLDVTHVIPVKKIPKTTSGKVQRSRLVERYLKSEFDDKIRVLSNQADSTNAFDTDPLIQELEKICEEICKEHVIRSDTNLFEVGISSLTLAEIVLAIDEKYPGKVDISDLFNCPTLGMIAELIRSKTK